MSTRRKLVADGLACPCASLGNAAASVDTHTGRHSAQVSWELMRGHLPALAAATVDGRQPEMGVFVGIQQMEYSGMAAPHLTAIGPYSATGGAFSVAAGRLSFTYGLKGKSRQHASNPDHAYRLYV